MYYNWVYSTSDSMALALVRHCIGNPNMDERKIRAAGKQISEISRFGLSQLNEPVSLLLPRLHAQSRLLPGDTPSMIARFRPPFNGQ